MTKKITKKIVVKEEPKITLIQGSRRHITKFYPLKWNINNSYKINTSLACGDYMKSYEYYKMIAKSEDITLLFKIFKHLEPDWLCKRNRNTLYFGDMKHKYRGMMFKLARYVRNKSIRVILENILLLLEEGFPIWEAIPLGHHSVASIPSYYNSSIDLIMVNWTYDSRKVLMYSNNSPVRYKTLSLFKTKCIRANYWNHIFASPHSTLTIATFRKLFNDKNYDELKKILENQ